MEEGDSLTTERERNISLVPDRREILHHHHRSGELLPFFYTGDSLLAMTEERYFLASTEEGRDSSHFNTRDRLLLSRQSRKTSPAHDDKGGDSSCPERGETPSA